MTHNEHPYPVAVRSVETGFAPNASNLMFEPVVAVVFWDLKGADGNAKEK